MRRVLVDAARARTALKRGGAVLPAEHSTAVDLDGIAADDSNAAASVCALHEALETLTQIDPRRARVIELRFFGGNECGRNSGSSGRLAADSDA